VRGRGGETGREREREREGRGGRGGGGVPREEGVGVGRERMREERDGGFERGADKISRWVYCRSWWSKLGPLISESDGWRNSG
jgi:hypothetical protein